LGDEELVERCRAGDRRAQTQFIERFKPMIFRRMFRHMGNREGAEDLTQEALIKCLTRLDYFRTATTLDGWVHRVSMNLMHDHFRAEAVRKETSMETAFGEGESPGDPDAEPADELLARHEERALVARAVGDLPEIYREVIVLAHYDERSVEEIARTLDIGLSAVKMRLQRARGMILKSMEKLYARR
jgi:RNA polymerase sigma-70 factor (ECF subfamily)